MAIQIRVARTDKGASEIFGETSVSFGGAQEIPLASPVRRHSRKDCNVGALAERIEKRREARCGLRGECFGLNRAPRDSVSGAEEALLKGHNNPPYSC